MVVEVRRSRSAGCRRLIMEISKDENDRVRLFSRVATWDKRPWASIIIGVVVGGGRRVEWGSEGGVRHRLGMRGPERGSMAEVRPSAFRNAQERGGVAVKVVMVVVVDRVVLVEVVGWRRSEARVVVGVAEEEEEAVDARGVGRRRPAAASSSAERDTTAGTSFLAIQCAVVVGWRGGGTGLGETIAPLFFIFFIRLGSTSPPPPFSGLSSGMAEGTNSVGG